MNDWGWRIPFLIAIPLGVVGLWIRTRLDDTPRFAAIELQDKKATRAGRVAVPHQLEALPSASVCRSCCSPRTTSPTST